MRHFSQSWVCPERTWVAGGWEAAGEGRRCWHFGRFAWGWILVIVNIDDMNLVFFVELCGVLADGNESWGSIVPLFVQRSSALVQSPC